MNRLMISAACVVLVLSTAAAMGQEKPKTLAEMNAAFASHGCKQQLIQDEEESTLLVTCAEDVVSRDKNLRTWFFADDLGDKFFNSNRERVTAMFMEHEAKIALLFYYNTEHIDQLAVVGRIMGRDDYGHPVDRVAFTYGFDRETYRKTDPEHVKWTAIRKISKSPMPECNTSMPSCPYNDLG
jgi:hypothetical protein